MISPAIAYTRIKMSLTFGQKLLGGAALAGGVVGGAALAINKAKRHQIQARDVNMAENLREEGSGEGSGEGNGAVVDPNEIGPDGRPLHPRR